MHEFHATPPAATPCFSPDFDQNAFLEMEGDVGLPGDYRIVGDHQNGLSVLLDQAMNDQP